MNQQLMTMIPVEELQSMISSAVNNGLFQQNILPDDTVVDRNFLYDNYKLSRRTIQSLEAEGKLIPRMHNHRFVYRLSQVMKALNLK